LFENFIQEKVGKSLLEVANDKSRLDIHICQNCGAQELSSEAKKVASQLSTDDDSRDKVQQLLDESYNEIGKEKSKQVDDEAEKEMDTIIEEIKRDIEKIIGFNNSFGAEQIRKYLKDNNISSISLKDNGELLIKYQNGETKTMNANNQQLKQIQSYLKSQDKQSY